MEIEVSDEMIQSAHKKLFSMGVFCEPSSAASLAAANILKSNTAIAKSKVLCVITGCGLKK
jgi:threonine synthase